MIISFMRDFDLVVDNTVNETLRDLDIKLSFAILIRQFQEGLKEDV